MATGTCAMWCQQRSMLAWHQVHHRGIDCAGWSCPAPCQHAQPAHVLAVKTRLLLSKPGVLPYLHVALALLPTDEEHKLVEAPELFLVHGLQGRKEGTDSQHVACLPLSC